MNKEMISECGNWKLEIKYDEWAESPRELCFDLGIMVCYHKRYDLGDKQFSRDFIDSHDGWDEVKQSLIEQGAIAILPLYLYDHSGITMNTTGFACGWDSGQVGFIYTTKEKQEEFGTADDRLEKCLRDEVETYDHFLTGQVYGFTLYEKVHHPATEPCVTCGHATVEDAYDEWEEVDDCWGFYGSDHEASGLFDNAGWPVKKEVTA